jgi:hypothetical protein
MTLKIFVNLTMTLKKLEQIIAYTRFLVLHDISCITVKVRPFLNIIEVPSIKLGHVIHLLSVHFLIDGDDIKII